MRTGQDKALGLWRSASRSKLWHLQQLTWPERRLLIRAFLLLPLTVLGLRYFGFRRFYCGPAALSHDSCTARSDAAETLVWAYTAARMIRLAVRYSPGRRSCLERSLALCWLLRSQGIKGVLCFGARKATGRFEAHAWVEYAGHVLNDRDDVHQRFAPFGRMIGPGRVKSL